MPLAFVVRGIPRPKGSTRAFVRHTRDGRALAHVTSDCAGLRDWERLVAAVAQSRPDCPRAPWVGPVVVTLKFTLPRPASAPRWRTHCIARPDLDKLTRGVLDALTGVLWRDDSQVVSILAGKAWGDAPGVEAVVDAAAEEVYAAKAAPRRVGLAKEIPF